MNPRFRMKPAWLLLIVLILPILAACGAPQGTTGPGAAATTATDTQTTPAAVADAPTTAPTEEATEAPEATEVATEAATEAAAGGAATETATEGATEAATSATTEATVEAETTAGAGETATVTASNGGLTEADGLMVAAANSCEAPYTGLIKEIAAVDPTTVRFTMCQPDPAFPAKAAFTSFAIQPSEYIEQTGGTGQLIEKPIGTGPYALDTWARGESITLKRFDGYWGEPAKDETLIFRWSAEAAQRLLELQSGTVDGIDNVGPDDFETVRNDANLQLLERPALNVMYVGMNNAFAPFDNEKVRQAIAMGIDRQRIVDNFYPPGSEVASHFTPCSIPNGCVGEAWYQFDPTAAKQLLAEAGFPNGFDTVLNYRDVVRGYLPDPGIVAQDIQAQLKQNLNINVTIEVQESGTFIDNADAGTLEGLYLLGWGADYPDVTNFLDYHFGEGASPQFGEKFDDITQALQEGARLADPEERRPAYERANNAIRQHVPMVPIAYGGSAVAYKADVQDAHVSPLGNETFARMDAGGGDRDTFVWMQNGEPPGLWCADESDGEALRVCEQITEALLSYEVGGTNVEPGLATACEPNDDLTVWTCNLRQNVKFHDGSDFDANDVVMSWYVQWDAASPLHKGRDGSFSYFSGLWGGFLNAPPAEE